VAVALPQRLLLHQHKLSHVLNQTAANQNSLNQATMFPHLLARIISHVNNEAVIVVAIEAATAVEIVAVSEVVAVDTVAAVVATEAEIAVATVVANSAAVAAAVMAAAPVVAIAVIVVAATGVALIAAETVAVIGVVAEAATTRVRVMANHHLVLITINCWSTGFSRPALRLMPFSNCS
jgi:hypothetical protein